MKKQVGSLVLLTTVFLGSYYITGLVAEHTIKKNINALNESRGLNLHLVSYHRGFFFSDIVLDSEVRTPERFVKGNAGQTMLVPSKTYRVDVPVRLYHGPVTVTADGVHVGLAYANSDITLPSPYAERFKKQYTDTSVLPSLNLKLWVTLTNKMKVFLNIPSFELTSRKDNSQLNWHGLTSEHVFSSGMKHMEGDIELSTVRMVQGTETAEMDRVSSTYHLKYTDKGLYVGDMSLSVPSIVLSNGGVSEFNLKALKIASSSDITKGLFDSSFHADFESMISNGKTYGPGRVTVMIKHLDAEALADINQKINQAQKNKNAQTQQATLAILTDIPKLLSKGASIELSEMNLMGKEGEIDGVLKFSLPENNDMKNPFQLIQQVQGEGYLKVSDRLLKEFVLKTINENTEGSIPAENAVESTNTVPVISKSLVDQKIEHLLQAGTLVKKGSDYVMDVRLSSGQMSINGHPLSAEMLQF